jgi:hypothetical protein
VPSNPWEVFMASLSAGDAKGCWFVVSGKAALLSAPVVGASLVAHAATGAAWRGWREGVRGWLPAACSALLQARQAQHSHTQPHAIVTTHHHTTPHHDANHRIMQAMGSPARWAAASRRRLRPCCWRWG